VTVVERSAPTFPDLFDVMTTNISRSVQGKTEAIELALICMLAEGHLLIEDVPGVGKTSLAKAIAASIDCSWRRAVHAGPAAVRHHGRHDLAPRSGHVRVPARAGVLQHPPGRRDQPRAPRTQSALLEAMEERQVTADGTTHPLPRPFLVIATQNPVEHEGTYGMPTASSTASSSACRSATRTARPGSRSSTPTA
jgi:MoxR-like ATPase